MKVFLGFFVGLCLGVFGVYKFTQSFEPKREVLSEETSTKTEEKEEELKLVLSEYTASETATPEPVSITSTVEKSVTPTKKITPTVGLTKTLTLTPTATPSTATSFPTASLTPTPTVSPTSALTPTIAVVVQTYSSAEINGFIDRFSVQYGVDPNVLRYTATCESGFNAGITSPNGLYAGLYQFSISAWNNYRGKMGESSDSNLRYNAEEAVQTAAYVYSIGQSYIWPNCVP